MAKIRIDLEDIVPELSKDMDEIRKAADNLNNLTREFYLKLYSYPISGKVIDEDKEE